MVQNQAYEVAFLELLREVVLQRSLVSQCCFLLFPRRHSRINFSLMCFLIPANIIFRSWADTVPFQTLNLIYTFHLYPRRKALAVASPVSSSTKIPLFTLVTYYTLFVGCSTLNTALHYLPLLLLLDATLKRARYSLWRILWVGRKFSCQISAKLPCIFMHPNPILLVAWTLSSPLFITPSLLISSTFSTFVVSTECLPRILFPDFDESKQLDRSLIQFKRLPRSILLL